jgi:hypothetical protein
MPNNTPAASNNIVAFRCIVVPPLVFWVFRALFARKPKVIDKSGGLQGLVTQFGGKSTRATLLLDHRGLATAKPPEQSAATPGSNPGPPGDLNELGQFSSLVKPREA